jgi:hypothetical protein
MFIGCYVLDTESRTLHELSLVMIYSHFIDEEGELYGIS